ncbi:MAG: hypothetical protein WC497_05475 [Patescibacteria group bacterium]
MKCLWHKCGAEFTPTQKNQKFCPGGKCQVAYNNYRKLHGHHLIPRIEQKLQDAANGQEKPVDQMLNEIVDMAIPTPGRPLTDSEIKGVNEIVLNVGEEGKEP